MNFEYHIYQYLLKYHKAEVPDFGVFELTKESAKIDAENSVITPPKEVVTFRYLPSLFTDASLMEYIAKETGNDIPETESGCRKSVRKWLDILQTENNLVLENLGQFQLDEQKNIIKIINQEDDFFGLETINLQTLKNPTVNKYKVSEDYAFDKKVIWTFLSLIIIGSSVLFFFGDQELIFGKTSGIPAKKIIKKEQPKKVETAPEQDSAKVDSIKPTTNAKIQKINR